MHHRQFLTGDSFKKASFSIQILKHDLTFRIRMECLKSLLTNFKKNINAQENIVLGKKFTYCFGMR